MPLTAGQELGVETRAGGLGPEIPGPSPPVSVPGPGNCTVSAAEARCCPCRKSGMTGRMELDVFVIGGVGIDTIVRVPELPLPHLETIRVEPVESYVGHTGHGVTLGCHLLGLRTALADVIGDDDEGYRIRRTYDELRLPLHVAIHPSGTRRAVNLVAPDGRRLSLYDGRHPAGLRVDPDLWRTN